LNNFNLLKEKIKIEKEREDVLSKLNKFLIKYPNCIYANLLLGDINLLDQKYALSKKYFLKSMAIDPRNVYTLFNLGILYNLEKKYDSSVLFFRTAAKLKTSGGFVLDKNRNLEKVTSYPTFDVEYSEIVYNDAISSYYANYFSDALAEFNYCISAEKNLKECYYLRALIYLKKKEIQLACQDFKLAKSNGNLKAEASLEEYCKE